MRIDRSHTDETFIDSVYLTNERNQPYLSRQNYIFITRGGTKNSFGWLTVVWVLVRLAFLIWLFGLIIGREWYEYQLLTTEGQSTLAVLAEKQATLTRSNSYVYILNYLYQVANQTYPLKLWVEADEYETAPNTRLIIYASSEPSLATADIRLDKWQLSMPVYILIIIAIIYLSAMAYYIFRKVWLIPAKIVYANAISRRIFWREVNSIELMFEFVSPKTHQIRSATTKLFSNTLPAVGQNIVIIFDNERKFFAL